MLASGIPTVVQSVDLKNRKMVDRFIDVPWFIHRHHAPNEYWVPPLRSERRRFLDPSRNPFFQHAEASLWLATRAGQDVGRIAAVRDSEWQRLHGPDTGSFGLFESIDDPDVARSLFKAAQLWLQDQGLKEVLGPLDLSTNHTSGLLVEGFNSAPFVGMAYNPPYYQRLLEQCGLRAEKDLWQWAIEPTSTPPPPHIVAAAQDLREQQDIEIRALRPKEWMAELNQVADLYNDIWSENWGFVPLTPAEMESLAQELRSLVLPEFALIALINGEPAGFALSIMNANPTLSKMNGRLIPWGVFHYMWDFKIRRNVKSGRLMLLGVRRPFRGLGVDALLILSTWQAASNFGWRLSELGWTSEDNVRMNAIISHGGGVKVKTYRVFAKRLGEN